ncbi:transposase [Cupriavidus necator]|uniref:IS66 family transposase n=1 Tax=Cupriavidus necator TaxID=106590 RepID=UPI0009BD8CA7|nr:transposase [Cupriavidus necator]
MLGALPPTLLRDRQGPEDARAGRAGALAWIAKLYAIEAGIKYRSPEHKLAVRQAEAVPLLSQFHQWLQGNAHGLLARHRCAMARARARADVLG